MNILYHHRTRAEDAQGIHINEMVRAFRKLGHNVEVVALTHGSRRQIYSRTPILSHLSPEMPIIYEVMEWGYNLIGYYKLLQAIKKQRPDFIYERYNLFMIAGITASKHFEIPIILEVNAPLAMERAQYGKLFFKSLAQRSEQWICSQATGVIAVSTPLKKILIKQGVPGHKIHVIPNGVNLTAFHPEVDGQKIRRYYGLQDKIIIGFIGWFRSWHAIEFLLEAVAALPPQRYNLHLLLVGDGPARVSIERMCKRLSLDRYVTITGGIPHEEVPFYIAAMDIAVQPYCTWYSSPMKIFEYMAMGKPILAPKLPNITEILTHGRNALLFTPMNADELRRLITELASDRGLREVLGKQAYQDLIDRNYTWEHNAQQVIRIIESLKNGD